jgi:hypothetical protein
LVALQDAAWRSDEQLLRQSQRSLGLLHARSAADTLLTPTAEEAYYAEKMSCTPETLGVELFVRWAADALAYWPHASPALAGGVDFLRGIHEALRAVLAMQAMRQTRSVNLAATTTTLAALRVLLEVVLNDTSWLHRLRSTCGLSQSDEADLRELQQELLQGCDARVEVTKSRCAAVGERAAADVARHGLRSCALPACGTTEEYRKTYKLCGRCRGVAYCCAAHSAEDWKRHKREDGCAAPPA